MDGEYKYIHILSMKSFDFVQVGKRVKKESAECTSECNLIFFGMHVIHLCFDFKTKNPGKKCNYKTKCNFKLFNLIVLHENYFNEL